MREKKKITKQQVKYILERFRIKISGNFTVDIDGLIDVNGSVCIINIKKIKLPLRFGKVKGDFLCKSNGLVTLYGSPKFVGGNFNCSDNELISLVGGPDYVGGSYLCNDNNLITLKGSPVEIIGRFNCAINKLKTLEHGPEKVGKSYYANHNQITSLVGCASSIGGSLHIEANLLRNLCNCADYIEDTLHFDIWIPSIYMGQKNCQVRNVKIESLGKIDDSSRMLPQLVIDNQKALPILFKYNKYLLEIWNNDGSFNEIEFNDVILDIREGLR